eukprot:scaffold134_cov61-Phaeocystis_antarctica.AAC.3
MSPAKFDLGCAVCTCARGCSRSHLGARACARRVRWIITSQCRHMTTQDPTAAPRTQLINLRRALEPLDAGERGAWASAGLSPEARARAAQRAVASQRGRLGARGVAAAPTKKAANTSEPVEKKGASLAKKWRGRDFLLHTAESSVRPKGVLLSILLSCEPRLRYPADRVGVRRDDVVGADVDGVRDAASLGGGAVLGRAGGG